MVASKLRRLGLLSSACLVVAAGSLACGSPGPPVIAAAGDISCDPGGGGSSDPDPDEPGPLGSTSATSATTPRAVASTCRMGATAELLAGQDLAGVLALGDLQYEKGSLESFQQSYDGTWGRFKDLTRPAVGNHEYGTRDAAGYFGYFGQAAGRPGQGWYSYDIGPWHLIALNSNCSKVGGCEAGSPQERWLAEDLKTHKNRCVLAYWHHPRFSSGQHGDEPRYDAFWRALYDQGADVVLVGHDHDYERFAPQDPDGRPDPTRGLRQFVVGTGGKNHVRFKTVARNSEVRDDRTFGVLLLTLHSDGYDWRFVPERGKTFTDMGHGDCH